jgi:acylphosphatase
MATSRGVAGWVRNNRDGTLQAALEGPSEAVEALVDFCRRGPRGAMVEDVDVSEEEPEGESGFRII